MADPHIKSIYPHQDKPAPIVFEGEVESLPIRAGHTIVWRRYIQIPMELEDLLTSLHRYRITIETIEGT